MACLPSMVSPNSSKATGASFTISPSATVLNHTSNSIGMMTDQDSSQHYFDNSGSDLIFSESAFGETAHQYDTPRTIYLPQGESGLLSSENDSNGSQAHPQINYLHSELSNHHFSLNQHNNHGAHHYYHLPSEQHSEMMPGTSQQPQLLLPTSPATSPQSSLELSSLQSQLEKNRETLKHKLSHRASIRELVCRGIYPSPRIPVGHVEQRRKLERAKTGDLLRHHFQSRPDREYLIGQNILQADGRIDFRIAARQKQLKKCRLAENLNQHLVTRPGPLDLVDRNILEAPKQLHIALRAGLLPLQSTSSAAVASSEVDANGSGSSDVSLSETAYFASFDSSVATLPSPASFVFDPVVAPLQQGTTVVRAAPAVTAASSTVPMLLSSNQQLAVYTPLSTIRGVIAPGSSTCDYYILPTNCANTSDPTLSGDGVGPHSFSSTSNTLSGTSAANNSASFSSGTRKASFSLKPNSKTSCGAAQKPKSQMLKFHEYKGPPDVVKKQNSDLNGTSTSAARRTLTTSDAVAREHLNILINQQSLYLKYQKYNSGHGSPTSSCNNQPSPTNVSPPAVSFTSASPIPGNHPADSQQNEQSGHNAMVNSGRLNRMVTRQTLSELRVSDLKSYCRQLGLPISGTKQILVDRLDSKLNSNRQPLAAPSHSSSALYFGVTENNYHYMDLNDGQTRVKQPDLGTNNRDLQYEETEDVITISSSASSPGVSHELNTGSDLSHPSNRVYHQQKQTELHQQWQAHKEDDKEQLLNLHHRVETQQRHIEQLKAELEIERQKRLNEGQQLFAGETGESNSMSVDAWHHTVLTGAAGHQINAQPSLPAGMLTSTELDDDIMDLISSFPANSNVQSSGHNKNGAYMATDNGNFTLLKSPSNSFNILDASPMSPPWLFDSSDSQSFQACSGDMLANGTDGQQHDSFYPQTMSHQSANFT